MKTIITLSIIAFTFISCTSVVIEKPPIAAVFIDARQCLNDDGSTFDGATKEDVIKFNICFDNLAAVVLTKYKYSHARHVYMRFDETDYIEYSGTVDELMENVK